jgi:hypothetical protein
MGSASGIELGPASCVLVSARASADGTEVSAVRVIEPAEWPGAGAALTATLKSIRKAKRLPRRARVVLWGVEKTAALSDPKVRAAVKPLVLAGFNVEAVLTPGDALAAVAATRRRPNEGPVAWLSVNMHGAAIAIVHGAKVLFSKTLAWSYDPSAQSVKAQLLQRYSFVAHIGPELKHAIERIRVGHALKVETVVTCGDLPDLRSLTMPLIEELDLEVETLDSPEGLIPRGEAAQERFAEWAPAIRLACAAAVAPVKRSAVAMPAAVAAGLLLAAAGVAAYVFVKGEPVVPIDTRVSPAAEIQTPKPAPAAEPKVERTPEPVVPVAPPVTETPKPADIARPRSTAGTVPPEKRGGQPLPPVPPVTSILIDNGRRLAMIGGSIVAVGDRVGPRVVVRIDAASVVLREPSGQEITVLLRPAGVDAVKLPAFAEQGRQWAQHR